MCHRYFAGTASCCAAATHQAGPLSTAKKAPHLLSSCCESRTALQTGPQGARAAALWRRLRGECIAHASAAAVQLVRSCTHLRMSVLVQLPASIHDWHRPKVVNVLVNLPHVQPTTGPCQRTVPMLHALSVHQLVTQIGFSIIQTACFERSLTA